MRALSGRRPSVARHPLTLALVVFALVATGRPSAAGPTPAVRLGPWRAWLDSPGGPLPFELELQSRGDSLTAFVGNGAERFQVPRVRRSGQELVLDIDYFDSNLRGRLSSAGTRWDGQWSRRSGDESWVRLPLHAVAGALARFPAIADSSGERRDGSHETVDGRWAVRFEQDEDPAIALLRSGPAGIVTGTFLTPTGDYRYLAGRLDGTLLRLSTFDGSHAFLFHARLRPDGTLSGDFWSGDRWHDRWSGRRDPTATLPDAFSQTRWTDGADLSQLVFPDLQGRPHHLDDPLFQGKARILYIFGSWCPNCADATELMVDLDARYHDRGLAILGLAFEATTDFARNVRQLRRYVRHHGVEYPILVGGLKDKDAASRALPILDQVRSYPTTIFLDTTGTVRAIHTGFSGPATLQAYDRLRARFCAIIETMLSESDHD